MARGRSAGTRSDGGRLLTDPPVQIADEMMDLQKQNCHYAEREYPPVAFDSSVAARAAVPQRRSM